MEEAAKDQPPKPKGKGGRKPLPPEEKAIHTVGPFLFTLAEKQEYDRIFVRSGLKHQAELIRQILFKGSLKLYYFDRNNTIIYEKLNDLQSELRDIGVNYNQAVKAINSFYKDPQVIAELAKLRTLTQQMLEVFNRVEATMPRYAPYNQKGLKELPKSAKEDTQEE